MPNLSCCCFYCFLLALVGVATGFVPGLATRRAPITERSRRLSLLPDPSLLVDLHFIGSTTQLVSDATAVTEEAAKTGAWESYLQTFKGGLLLVHDKLVDPPLKAAGVERTWGVSIAVFTAFVRSALVPLSFQQVR